jgi:hypothetical protein
MSNLNAWTNSENGRPAVFLSAKLGSRQPREDLPTARDDTADFVLLVAGAGETIQQKIRKCRRVARERLAGRAR